MRAGTSIPRGAVYRGEYRHDEMRRQRVSEEEIRAALRSSGTAQTSGAGVVVLESDGSFSVIGRDALPASGSVLPA